VVVGNVPDNLQVHAASILDHEDGKSMYSDISVIFPTTTNCNNPRSELTTMKVKNKKFIFCIKTPSLSLTVLYSYYEFVSHFFQ
jgi:hypothetical protein